MKKLTHRFLPGLLALGLTAWAGQMTVQAQVSGDTGASGGNNETATHNVNNTGGVGVNGKGNATSGGATSSTSGGNPSGGADLQRRDLQRRHHARQHADRPQPGRRQQRGAKHSPLGRDPGDRHLAQPPLNRVRFAFGRHPALVRDAGFRF